MLDLRCDADKHGLDACGSMTGITDLSYAAAAARAAAAGEPAPETVKWGAPPKKPPADQKPTNPKDAAGSHKLAFSCVPWAIVCGMAAAMFEGSGKYGRHNYRHPLGVESDGPSEGTSVRASIYFDAAMRHLVAYWEGEDVDPDSGLLHLDKAAASLAVWRDAVACGTLYDDRPPPSSVPALIRGLNEKCAALVEKIGSAWRKPWVRCP